MNSYRAGEIVMDSSGEVLPRGQASLEDSWVNSEFCELHPLTRLVLTRHTDHLRIIQSESVWQVLKSQLNYDDSTIGYSADIIHR